MGETIRAAGRFLARGGKPVRVSQVEAAALVKDQQARLRIQKAEPDKLKPGSWPWIADQAVALLYYALTLAALIALVACEG
jgi:hypothetical protein